MRLKNKVALITGAASGIGKASAELFSREGAKVIAVDKDSESLYDVTNRIQEMGMQCLPYIADVSQEEACAGMIQFAEKRCGALHILFNNAGIMHSDDDDAVNTDPDVFRKTLEINVLGVFLGCKYGIPSMRRAGGGSVINTASFVAKIGAATAQIAYTASKGAVLSMTKELAVIHAREGIRVNALCPGPLKTELLMKFLDTAEKKQRRLVHIPMGRFGEADDMAKSALFLASDESSYMTGSEFLVDGGITASYVTPE
jgi:NAD(P)-dependent dehydrogenase (short-subunit alcohol dehydrogenase family)